MSGDGFEVVILSVACLLRCRERGRTELILTGCGAVTLSGRSAATPLRDQMQSLRQAEALPLRPFRCVQVTPHATLPLLGDQRVTLSAEIVWCCACRYERLTEV